VSGEFYLNTDHPWSGGLWVS